MNFMKAVKTVGQPFCVLLYGIGIFFAAKKKFIPLTALFLTHLTEYFIIGRKTGKEKNISPVRALLSCLSFGFTWWLPLGKEKE